MNYESITYPDVNNGIGCRVTLWISGCTHHCKGCQNRQTWDFDSGKTIDNDIKEKLISILKLPYIKGLTLSGGDPLCSYDEVVELVKELKEILPDKDIWLYTGFTMDIIKKAMPSILKYIDVIVDGEFIENKRDITLAFRGSSNQKIWEKDKDGDFILSKLN